MCISMVLHVNSITAGEAVLVSRYETWCVDQMHIYAGVVGNCASFWDSMYSMYTIIIRTLPTHYCGFQTDV